MTRCAQVEELLPLYADGGAAEEERGLVEEHLGGCPGCREVLDYLRRADAIVAGWPELPADMRPHLARVDEGVRRRTQRGLPLFSPPWLLRHTRQLAASLAFLLFLGGLVFVLSSTFSQIQRAARPAPESEFTREQAIGKAAEDAKRPAPGVLGLPELPPTIPPADPTAPPAPTVLASAWKTFSSPANDVSLRYPPHWERDTRYGTSGDQRYSGPEGFFQLSAMEADSIDQAAQAEADHKLQPYGSRPTITTTRIEGQDARLILPSDDQSPEMNGQAALVVRHRRPVQVAGARYSFLVLWADKGHIESIAGSMTLGPPAAGDRGVTATPVPVQPTPPPPLSNG